MLDAADCDISKQGATSEPWSTPVWGRLIGNRLDHDQSQGLHPTSYKTNIYDQLDISTSLVLSKCIISPRRVRLKLTHPSQSGLLSRPVGDLLEDKLAACSIYRFYWHKSCKSYQVSYTKGSERNKHYEGLPDDRVKCVDRICAWWGDHRDCNIPKSTRIRHHRPPTALIEFDLRDFPVSPNRFIFRWMAGIPPPPHTHTPFTFMVRASWI